MIEEPPPIVFAPSIERPSADIVERFRAPTSFIVDAMNGTGALDWRIKRLVGKSFVGVALTCDCGPLDNLAFMAALAESKPGDVFMVATNGYVAAAVTGDLLMYVARNRGAAAFVTDGLVRDLDDLETVGLPTFAMGVTPNSPQRRGPGSVGLPLDDTLNQAFDPYTFIKNAFLQQREYAVKDGNVPSPKFDDEPLEDPDPGADKK